MLDLAKNLNEPQREAVTSTEGLVVVVAGAGSGKTRVITYRVAYLIGERGVRPYNILAVTFTNKAAEEMRNRVYRLVGTSDLEAWIGTFHSTCARILRREAHRLGYERNFAIYDESDQLSLIKSCMKQLSVPERDYSPRAIQSHISLAKNNMVGPEDFETLATDHFEEETAKVYRRYQQALRRNNAMDFDDLLNNMLTILISFPDSCQRYQNLFRYILVDEFQDTNRVQYQIVRELARQHRNLCVVGDDDQSIYSWRGANIDNLFDLQDDFPEAKTVFLEENYRSTRLILDAANSIIANNDRRKPKTLWTNNERGEKVTWYPMTNEYAEAWIITETVSRLKREYPQLARRDFAVFYRTNAQSRVLEDAFREAALPYIIVGSVKFYDRKEIKDIMAYLKVIANPNDSVSLRRIINTPPRGIGKTTLERADEFASEQNVSLLEAIGRAREIQKLRGDTRASLLGFQAYISNLAKKAAKAPALKLINEIIESSGYAKMLRQNPSFEAQSRLENLGELLSAASEFAEKTGDNSLEGFLQNTSLQTDIDEWDEKKDAVTLMTLHMAKGLEFPVVFIAGMEEGLFPHANALSSERAIEEERRLCYVGVTRGKKRVILTSADTRRLRGTATSREVSRFVTEIPHDLIESCGDPESAGYPYDDYYQEMPEYEGTEFHVGDVVEHSTFGPGKISAFSGSGEKMKVAVRFFRDNKERDLLIKYATLRKR